MKENSIEGLTKTALFSALVFVGTFIIKIPAPFGYMHLGDCIIFLAVLMLGGRKAAVAGAVGAGLADLVSGYVIWFIPTVICKCIMALVMGYFISKRIFRLQGKSLWLTGAAFGGISQSIGYTITRIFLYGAVAAVSSIPLLLVQTSLGIIFALFISESLQRTHLKKMFLFNDGVKEVNQSC